jgi:Transposase DDE domain
MQMIAYQPELSPALRTVVGNVDYTEFRETLQRIERLLIDSGTEARFVRLRMNELEREGIEYARKMGKAYRALSAKARANVQKHAVRALRCDVVRELTGESARGLSIRLADSELLQWFCRIDRVDVVRVPSKSTLDRYEKLVPERVVREVVDHLNGDASSITEDGQAMLGLERPLDIDALFLDTSCVKANIHYPVDWVLLRDATRTLMKAVAVIRKHGLKNRMSEPSAFIRQINRLSIEMTHTRRRPDSRRARKQVLRSMKKLLKKIDRHARKHADLLRNERERTELTEAEATMISKRIDGIRKQLPQAVRQAHERIIGSRLVPNDEKILSLYEPDIHVSVRGKTGAEVEFGNTLLLAEQRQGVIVDWRLIKDQAPADSTMVPDCLDRFEQVFGTAPAAMSADRGFDSTRNRRRLDKDGVFNAICPRSVSDLRERMKEEPFVQLQGRRAQTESRIAIFKNGFLGRPLRSKGFTHREGRVAWAVLAHNLWVIARLPLAEEQPGELAVAA